MTLPHADLLQLKRWNTPTIYNGWEQITSHDVTAAGINLEETRDFMPQMGPMVGYAVTLVIEPSAAGPQPLVARVWQLIFTFRHSPVAEGKSPSVHTPGDEPPQRHGL